MRIQLMPIIALSTALLFGCQQAPDETLGNSTETDENSGAYTADNATNSVESSAMIEVANAEYELAIRNADADYVSKKESCNRRSGMDRDACLSAADATLENTNANASIKLEEALLAAANYE